jgi:Zn-dependent protease
VQNLDINIARAVIMIICFIPAIVLHELGHGYVAFKMGDTTAKAAGRLTLNPIKHIDPFGTVLLPVMLAITGMPVFGYAKPVPYNPGRFKNIKKGEVLTGLAGPAVNLILALLTSGIVWLLLSFLPASITGSQGFGWVYTGLYFFVLINLVLMFFNLLPIPPLDGSSIIMPFIPRKYLPTWYKVQRYAMPILLVVVILVPMILRINPLGIYLDATAGNLTNLIFPS